MKRNRGSITVFICIILSVLIPLCGILMDLARYNEAVRMADSSLKLCVESMLAAYDRQLKEQFGLLAMYPRDVESMEKEIYELLSDNLTPENAEGNVTDLYRFRVNRVEVIPIYNLSEPYVLEQQVTEFMKYRAPVQAVSEFLEKLKSMANLARESEVVEHNMTLDKLLNGLREDMIYFALLMDQKMENINKNSQTENYASAVIAEIESNNQKENALRPKQETIDAINEKMAEYRERKAEYEEAKSAYESAESAFRSVEERLDRLEEELEEAQNSQDSSGGSEEGQEDSESSRTDARIQALESQIAELQSEYDDARSALESAEERYDEARDQLGMVVQKLNELLNKLLECYKGMFEYTCYSELSLKNLEEHLALHDAYCAAAIELGQDIVLQAKNIQEEKKKLESAMDKCPDSAVVQQVKADLEKKLISIDPEHIGQIIGQLEKDKEKVAGWLEAVSKAHDAYIQMTIALNHEIAVIEALINDKGDGNQVVNMYTGNDNNTTCVNELKQSLSDLDAYSTMKTRGVYVIPDYQLVPPATEKEQQGFDIWYANAFEGKALEQQKEPENSGLENARKKAGEAAGCIAEGKDASKSGGDKQGDSQDKDGSKSLDDLLKRFGVKLSVPSMGGVVSSEDSLAAISEHVRQTRQERSARYNPLDDPVQGADSVNEKDEGFFDHELERIRKFFAAIGDLLKDGGESLLTNLYMNEYIVSAFKNCTTTGNRLENDIGWLRPLDKTYFNKAEVEYIIFGHPSEKSNIAEAKRTLTVIRMFFNLLHVYTDPEKQAFTFKVASAIAGWTIFGVPIVQNFLLISWAALESWVDAEKLMAGEQVPLLKTSQSWFLDPKRLEDYLINNVIASLEDFVVDKTEALIDEGAASLEETVKTFISGQVDAMFSGITENWCQAADAVSQRAQDLANGIDFSDIGRVTGDTVEDFLESLRDYMADKLAAFCESIRDEGAEVIAECRKAVQERVYDALERYSAVFNDLKEEVKQFARDTLEKGFDAATDKISGVLGASGGSSSGASHVLGRLIMMDYTDYLRLMLLTVDPEKKALRCADLIQLNMYTALQDNCKPISSYHTTLYVKAWIDVDLWVIPESFYKKDKEGMIVVEWAQGY